MPRKGSDNFGDQVSGPPTPNYVPSEKSQLRRRHLNDTGLPEGVRDDIHSGDAEDESSEERERRSSVKATATRTRRSKRSSSRGKKVDKEPELEQKEEDTDTLSVGSGSKGFSDRLRSPLGSSLKLDELREQFSKGVEIKFAPLHIPPHRRLQTAAVALWALLMPLCVFIFLLIASVPRNWYLLIPYISWILLDKAPDRGGRPKTWARGFPIWKYFAQYYPCSIVKEADLPADRPYLFGYHPHGIIGMGAFATFATEGTGFSGYCPGIKPHLLTLESNFHIPFYRDLLLLHGVCSVSKRSCFNILSQGPGSAITIVVGGAAESLSAHPGTADLTLKKRFGFIKMAIRAGADLVPVFSFGENDIYDQLANHKGSIVYKLQKRFQGVFGFTLPLFYGRGLFNYNYGLMPFRHPIVSVVGRPINVRKDANPTDEHVQELQQLYIEELMRIWDRYKDVYAQNRTKELTLVE